MKRFYYRCSDCLSVCAIDAEEAPTELRGECGGTMQLMGEVRRFRVFDVSQRCACDERCTSATGPSCNCSCGGKNHGSGAVVEVLCDRGPLPVVCACNFARATEYRAALDAARARVNAAHGDTAARRREGMYVSSDAYWAWRGANEALAHARGLKTHKGRLAALAGV